MRKLTLTKETVAELTADDLTTVVAAAGTLVCVSDKNHVCVTSQWSYVDTCLTHPCTE